MVYMGVYLNIHPKIVSYTPYTPEKIYTRNGVYGCIFEYTPGPKGVYANLEKKKGSLCIYWFDEKIKLQD